MGLKESGLMPRTSPRFVQVRAFPLFRRQCCRSASVLCHTGAVVEISDLCRAWLVYVRFEQTRCSLELRPVNWVCFCLTTNELNSNPLLLTRLVDFRLIWKGEAIGGALFPDWRLPSVLYRLSFRDNC